MNRQISTFHSFQSCWSLLRICTFWRQHKGNANCIGAVMKTGVLMSWLSKIHGGDKWVVDAHSCHWLTWLPNEHHVVCCSSRAGEGPVAWKILKRHLRTNKIITLTSMWRKFKIPYRSPHLVPGKAKFFDSETWFYVLGRKLFCV